MKYDPIVKPWQDILTQHSFADDDTRIVKQEVKSMGYKIQYGPALKAEIKSRPLLKKYWKAAALLMATAAALVLVSLGGTETLRDLFIPGDADVTNRALTELTENIREGESFSDAITAFCLEIIEGAELS